MILSSKASKAYFSKEWSKSVLFLPEESVISTGSFLIILTKLCGIYIENNLALNRDTEVKDDAFMRSLAMIHERYNEKLTIEQLAKEARLSKSTFMRRFLQICK